MTDKRNTLGEYFAMEIIGPATQKRLFGGYNVRAWSVVVATVYSFQKGSLLGYSRADRYELLCTILAQPGSDASVAETFRNVSKKQWEEHGQDSASLFDFVVRSEFPTLNMADPKVLKAMSKRKIRLGEVLDRFSIAAASGIGFGATLPEDFKAIWQRSYEQIDHQDWSRARQHGVDIPEDPTTLPLDEATRVVLTETAQYVRKYFPQLTRPLGLDDY